MQKNNKQEVIKYWQEKEREIGEEIRGKDMSEYLSGYSGIKGRTWGLLYYTDTSFYFQTFPKKNWWTSLMGGGEKENQGKARQFKIPWSAVKEIILPTKKKSILAIFSPPDYRVFIKYQKDNIENILVFLIYSRSTREKFGECFQKYRKKMSC